MTSIHNTSSVSGQADVRGNVEIGKYCTVGRGAILTTTKPDETKASTQWAFYRNHFRGPVTEDEKITIGNDVRIESSAIIRPGVSIGNGAIVKAGSVVDRDIEPYEVVAGNPAERKRWRYPEHIRSQLEDIKWWNWNQGQIQRNKDFFYLDLANMDGDIQLTDFIK